MKKLEEKILKEGIIIADSIVKVDNFINYQIDRTFTMEMTKDIVEHFKEKNSIK